MTNRSQYPSEAELMERACARHAARLDAWTPADSALASCLLEAMTSKEIAGALGVSVSAVDCRVVAMAKVFGVRDRLALALRLQTLEAGDWPRVCPDARKVILREDEACAT